MQSTLPLPITGTATATAMANPLANSPVPSMPSPSPCSAILRRGLFGQPSAPPYGFLSRPVVVASQNPTPRVSRRSDPGHSKNFLRAREGVKESSTLASLDNLTLPPLSPSQAVATVAAAHANFMRVFVQSDPSKPRVELLCVVRAMLKKMGKKVLVGDKVLVGSIDWVGRRGMIENVFDRRSVVLNPLVANVNKLLVLFSMDQPKLDPLRLSRFLVEAESTTRVSLTLALNKSELVSQETLMAWKSRLCGWGYDPIFCSVDSKDGLDTLALTLRGQTSVLVGPSGVGKSSLINALRGNQHIADAPPENNWIDPILGSKWLEDQRVNEVSARSGKGKHTTRNVSLLPLVGGGYLADTPGFSQPSLMNVTKHSLAETFPEIREMLGPSPPAKCAFDDCLHLTEPGCLVKKDWERYTHYLQFLDEISIREGLQLRTLGTKREGDRRFKIVNETQARLKVKKSERQPSRQRVKQLILKELAELDDHDDY